MGCDIHAYIDYDSFIGHDNKVFVNCFAKLHLGRDYDLFNEMAGVRGPGGLFSPRGLPESVSWCVDSENTLMVMDGPGGEECCTKEVAERWVDSGASNWTDDRHIKVTHPDWHSRSYLYVKELLQVIKALPYSHIELQAAVAAMKKLNGKDSKKSRLVFWFDN